MSETKREARIVYVSRDAAAGVYTNGWWHGRPTGDYDHPATLLPMNDGDPKPGETWKCGAERVTIMPGYVPELWGDGPHVCIKFSSGRTQMVSISELSPLPTTETIRLEVEASPGEIAAIRKARHLMIVRSIGAPLAVAIANEHAAKAGTEPADG